MSDIQKTITEALAELPHRIGATDPAWYIEHALVQAGYSIQHHSETPKPSPFDLQVITLTTTPRTAGSGTPESGWTFRCAVTAKIAGLSHVSLFVHEVANGITLFDNAERNAHEVTLRKWAAELQAAPLAEMRKAELTRS